MLLVIHLFNFAGYNLLFQYAINKSETRLIQQLDADMYDEEDLIVLKVSLHLPYYNASSSAERVDGEIEISGTHYNYVKRQVINDTLYLYCIPNTEKTKLSQTQRDYSKQVTDVPADTKKSDANALKKMKWGAEYSDDFSLFTGVPSTKALQQKADFLLETIPFPPVASPYEPPETA